MVGLVLRCRLLNGPIMEMIASYTTPVRKFGTKFAADNWMHKSMGIQLGLTDSLRCQLPEGTDGTGYWKLDSLWTWLCRLQL